MLTPSEADAAYLRELASRLAGESGREDAVKLRSIAGRLEARDLPARAATPGRGLVRYECLDDGEGTSTFLLVAEAGGTAGALVVEVRPGGETPRVYGARFRAGAARAPAHGLLATMSPLDATPGRMRDVGLPTDDPAAFRTGVMASLVRFACEAAAIPSENRSAFLGKGIGRTCEGPEGWFRKLLARDPMPVPAGSTDAPVLDLPVEPDDDGKLPDLPACGLDGWIADVTVVLRPSGLPWPDQDDWDPGVHAFFSAPGVAGRYRRQAARAIPALAESLYETKEVTRAVDAGEPVFEALRRRLAALLPRHIGAGLTTAKLRRLATLDRPIRTRHAMDDLMGALAHLPMHLLPTTSVGWEAFFRHGVEPARMLGRIRVDAGALMRGYASLWLDPDAARPPADPEEIETESELIQGATDGLRDMLDDFGSDVPVLLGRDLPSERRSAVAARVLLRPRTLDAAFDLQARWHVGLPAFRSIQGSGSTLAWPALFEDYRAGDLVVTCLTSEAELVAEGMNGPDADGMGGLSHCVGTYARRCLAGECHIASVRVELAGCPVRLSTLEIELSQGRPRLRQHYGHGNGRPPGSAGLAVTALMQALWEGKHPYIVPSPSTALAQDMSSKASPEVLFEAWKPYLPPRIARGGLSALRTLLARDPDVTAAGGLPQAA